MPFGLIDVCPSLLQVALGGGTHLPAVHPKPVAHSAPVVQVVLHATLLAQARSSGQGAGVPFTQSPAPSQLLVVSVLLEHVEPQLVPVAGYEHSAVSLPLHVPAHLPVPWPVHFGRERCGVPETGEHVPSAPETSHAWQSPVHASLQQYPSMQMLLVHWSCAVHFTPSLCRGAQMWAAVQYAVAIHCESLVQLVGHEPAAQTYGSQTTPEPGSHIPAPLQSRPSAEFVEVWQVLVPQEVPAG
jgi:hypothetical protein